MAEITDCPHCEGQVCYEQNPDGSVFTGHTKPVCPTFATELAAAEKREQVRMNISSTRYRGLSTRPKSS